MSPDAIDRREFVKTSLCAAAAGAVYVPSTAIGANDRISLGFVGAGNRAQTLIEWVFDIEKTHNVEFTVVCDIWTERRDGSVRIEQTIFVARDGQKAIMLGKGGQTIKQVSMDSRRELTEILERPVHLFLFVKVREGWGDDPERYREMGLEFPKE